MFRSWKYIYAICYGRQLSKIIDDEDDLLQCKLSFQDN